MAIKKANGKFICFLDTDDWWSPDKLKEQINLVLKNKKQILSTPTFIFLTKIKKLKSITLRSYQVG